MPLSEKFSVNNRRRPSFGKTTKSQKSIRHIAPLLIASVALLAAVVFAVSVESRSSGWLRKLAPAGNSERAEKAARHSSANGVLEPATPAAPLVPTVTATKTDSLFTDVDMDGKADPGDTLKYSVTIGATGMDAEGVTFTDTVDANTAFVAGTLMTTPLARPDSYTATGNIRITVAAPGVLGNDTDVDGVGPALNVTAGIFMSANGGDVNLSADGSFTYNPPAGFEGTDTFTYTLNDGEGPSDTGTVSITVSDMIWFINNNASCPCDGRLTNPFNTLAAFQDINIGGGNNPKANHNIFVYESITDYIGPVSLLSGQKFIGQDATASLASISGVTLAPGSDSLPATNSGNGTIVNITSAGVAITLGMNNTLRGFTGGNATTDINGVSFGTANISDVTLNGTGRTLSLDNGTLNGAFGSLSSTNSATTGLTLISVGGSLTTGSTTVTNPSDIGITVNTSSATLNFANTSVTGSGNTGISLTTNTGAITFGSLTITPDAGQRGLLATNNTMTITATSGSVSTSNAVAVEITRASMTTPLAISLTSVAANGGTSGIVLTNTSGSFTITGNGADMTLGGNGTGGTITGMTNAGINLSGVTNLSLTSMLIQNGGDDGIRGLNVNGFTMNRSRVINNGNATLERGLDMTNLLGTSSITNSLVTGNAEDNLYVQNGSGTLNLTTTNTTYANNSATVGNDGIHFIAANVSGSNNANMSITVTNCIFTNNRGDHFQATTDAVSSATQTVVFQNNDLNNTVGTNLGAGLTLNPGGTAVVNFNISNNGTGADPFTGAFSSAITINSSNNSTMSGTISNNVIGNPAVTDSGSFSGDGITVFANGASDITVAITNNTIREYSNLAGIDIHVRDNLGNPGGGTINATVTGNTISDAGSFASHGILAQAGSVTGDDHFLCVDIGGAGALANSIAGSGANGGDDFRIRQRFGTTVRLPGYVGGATDTAAVVAFIQGRNNGMETGSATVQAPGVGFVGGAACASPALGPITMSAATSESTEMLTMQNDEESQPESILWATKGENKNPQNNLKLTPAEVSAMVQAATARWAESGASAKNLNRLHSLRFEIEDLPDGQLAIAKGSRITLDETAAGYGWFFDATPSDDNEFEVPVINKEQQTTELSGANGRMDLLTVLLRQLGSRMEFGKAALKGPSASLMENTLDTGVRRAPAFRLSASGKAPSAQDAKARTTTAAKSNQRAANDQQVASLAPRNARVNKHHATITPRAVTSASMADVMLNIGVLPAGKSITITFNVTVDDPFLGMSAQVCNQGVVSGTNFADVLTDDPDVSPGAADPTCTLIDLQADLEITAKNDSPDPVIAGNNITYTINFQNNGPNASGATVTDTTPVGTTFVSANVTSGMGWTTTMAPSMGGTGDVVFSKATVASGEMATFEIVVKVNSSVAGGSTITNTATAATTGATDPDPDNNSKTAMTAVVAQADLSITKTDGAETEIPGTSVTYTITVSNAGPSDANGVMVTDTFPAILTGVMYTSVASGGATGNTAGPAAGDINDTVNMPAGSSITYTVNATIASSATGELTNTATVTEPAGVTDPNQANNSATDTDTLTPEADLSITKTDGATTEVPGTPVTYTIVVTNNGPSDANGVMVADNFPAILTGASYTSVAAGGATGNTVGPAAGDINDTLNMPAGSSVTYTVTADIDPSATGNLVNTATVTEPAGVTDPNQANNSATDTDTLTPEADLSITKTDGAATEVPGTPVTYTIVVTNNGPSDANGVSVTDNFPAILTGVSYTSVAAGGATGNTVGPAAGNINDTLNMPAGSSVTYTATANINPSAVGNLSNTATVTAPGGVTDPNLGNNSATDTDTLTPEADLAVTKMDSPDPVIDGNNITYSINVTNNGPSDAQSLSLSDMVPANTTLVSVTTPAGWVRTDLVPAGGTGTITFTATSLAAGAFSDFTIVVNVNAGTANGTIISNTASVASPTTDPVPGNNSATATTLVQNEADLEVTKSVSPMTTINAGANATYTVTVKNNGPSPATTVTFTDVVPTGVSVVSQTSPMGWTCNTISIGGNGTITCTKATMAVGEMATLTVVAMVNCNVAHGATISNTATISAASPSDSDTSNNTATASFTVNNPAPVVTASVSINQLPQNSHDMINVGLMASATDGNCPSPTTFTVQVFGDEDDEIPTGKNELHSPDAKDIGIGTLRLRAERIGAEDGRVYLIVVKATDAAGQTGFATVTVVVAKNSSPGAQASVEAQAAAAKAFADANNGAPPAGYFVIGDGPIIGPKQ